MHNRLLREEIEDFYCYLQNTLRSNQLTIHSNEYDLVLDIMPVDDQRISWSYYYACHDTRCLFWLETYDASYIISELPGTKSPAHISSFHVQVSRHFINVVCRASSGIPLLVSQLHHAALVSWNSYNLDRNHCFLFPAAFGGQGLPLSTHDELMGMLSYGCVGEFVHLGPWVCETTTQSYILDVRTSKSSTLPFDNDTMQNMIKIVQNARSTPVFFLQRRKGWLTRYLSIPRWHRRSILHSWDW